VPVVVAVGAARAAASADYPLVAAVAGVEGGQNILDLIKNKQNLIFSCFK
jgi:hypothetical protein